MVAWCAPKILILNRLVRMSLRYMAAEYSFLQKAFIEAHSALGTVLVTLPELRPVVEKDL